MRILTKSIFRETLSLCAIALLVFMVLLLTGRMLQLLSLIVNRGVAFGQIVKVFAAIVPTFLEFALPMACLLGVIMAFARLSGDSELIVLRGSGVALHSLIPPVVALGVLALALNLIVSLSLRPLGNRVLGTTLFEIAQSRATAGLSGGTFNNLGPIVVYAERVDQSTSALSRVLIDDKRDRMARQMILAKSGQLLSDPESRSLIIQLRDGSIHQLSERGYLTTKFDVNQIVVGPEQLQGDAGDRTQKAKELNIPELAVAIDEVKPQLAALRAIEEKDAETIKQEQTLTKNVNRLRIEIARKFSMPVACLILALLGMALGVQQPRAQRAWGIGLAILLGLIVFLVYYGLLSLAFALAEQGSLSPYIGVWIPNIVCLLIALLLLQRVCAERWTSVIDQVQTSLRWAVS